MPLVEEMPVKPALGHTVVAVTVGALVWVLVLTILINPVRAVPPLLTV